MKIRFVILFSCVLSGGAPAYADDDNARPELGARLANSISTSVNSVFEGAQNLVLNAMGFMGIPVPEQYAPHPPLSPPPITSRVLFSGTAAPGSIMFRTPTRISSEHVVADLRVLTLLIASDMLLPWRKSVAAAPLPVSS